MPRFRDLIQILKFCAKELTKLVSGVAKINPFEGIRTLLYNVMYKKTLFAGITGSMF